MNDSVSRPSAQLTGQVIAFPRPKRPGPAAANTDAARADTLSLSLAALQRALAEQGEVVASWRAAAAELRGAVQGLGASLAVYRGSLDALGNRVETLGAQARALESRAGAALPRA
jgi:hypothetical protein